ncbi:hypothetical protein EJB05_04169 [Eragrostis curvula]|uniref:Glycolipid transfer protein domain-containing protein n=1 Tax=Eragrostis curvula TaxID=38414 RepID=A0A5J9W9A5_9POAL|nr:hypothetical protein EJB05_04169 [Eragrostis curvula]
MGSSEAEKPLRRIAASFEELAAVAKQQPAGAMDAGAFSGACSNVSVLFGCLGIAFKFAEMDYVAKVNDLVEASKTISTLPSMVELDIQNDTVRKAGSHTRNMLRVKRGIDMVKVLFEQILVTEGNSLRDAASVAYAQVFAPHHDRAIRMAVAAGMYALPSKSQLLKKLNEDGEGLSKGSNAELRQIIGTSNPLRGRTIYLKEFRHRLVKRTYILSFNVLISRIVCCEFCAPKTFNLVSVLETCYQIDMLLSLIA